LPPVAALFGDVDDAGWELKATGVSIIAIPGNCRAKPAASEVHVATAASAVAPLEVLSVLREFLSDFRG
jgi:hypothetical protein